MIACLRFVFAFVIATAATMPAVQAQDAAVIYVVSYFDTQPSAKGEVGALLKGYRDAARKESGNLRAEVLQNEARPGQYVVATAWKDQQALDAHTAAATTKDFREKIKAQRISPQDDRVHTGLSVGPIASADAARGIYVVTHVDVVPPRKDDAVGLLKAFGDASRKDDGNVRYEIVQQTNRPNHFTVIEAWKSRKAFDSHTAAAPVREFHDKLQPMSGALYDERLYRLVSK